MLATHINYLHPRHLRAMHGGKAYCVAPSHSQYSVLSKKRLPDFTKLDAEARAPLLAVRA